MVALGTASSAAIIKPILDKIFIEKNEEMLYLLPLGIIVLYTIKASGAFMQVYFSSYIGQDIVRRLRDRIVDTILSFEMGFFHEFRSGELISRSMNDIERVRQVVSSTLPIMTREFLTILALLGYVFYLDPQMALLSIIFIPLTAKPISMIAKKMKKFSHTSQERTSDLTARLSEIFNNIEVIKASAAEQYESKRFEKENQQIFDVNIKATKTGELVSPLMEIIGSLGVALVIIYGGKEVINGDMSVGSFFSFLTALFMLYTPVKRVSNLYNKMQDAIAASERIFSILNRKSKIEGGKIVRDGDINKIEFNGVDLDYSDKKTLKNITFSIKKGDTLALVGNSGSGKSSIVNLLLRFYDTNKGEILFNKESIKNYTLNSIRDSISIVTQRVYIFNDTIAQNVAYGKVVDKEKVVQSLKSANAWDFVKSMPQGINTTINEFGTNLSGGQRQRLAIARAIYRDPKIFIFDEATSALDTQSEQKITDALKKISKDKITIIIAHRLKTIEHANEILVLKDGEISCKGNKSELMKHCIDFKQLNGLQK